MAPGEVGELVLRGETIMKCYWNRPEATADTIRDGWLHTGDLAVVDADGYITLVDRLKDMIITGGRNVYSVEVENALAGHPGLLDVAVIGVPHPDYGESILAVIVPADGAEPTVEALREWARDADRGLQGSARGRGASHPAESFGEDPEAPAAGGADPG